LLLTKNKNLRQIQGLFETFNPLFFKLLLKNPLKVRAFPGEVFRAYMSLVGKDKWICKDIFDVFPGVEEACKIVIEHLPGADRNLPLHELACLALITKVVNPRQVFEIGTYTGRTALNFAQNSPEDCIVWTLDSPPTEAHTRTIAADDNIEQHTRASMDYKGKNAERKIRPLYGNSSAFDFSPYFGKIDMVFVNGAHHYEAVKSDTVNALRMVKPNGYVIWHDFANYGDCNDITRAVLDILSGDNVVQIAATQLALFVQPSETLNSDLK
jgi:predicted O-methyltransferase YrrM